MLHFSNMLTVGVSAARIAPRLTARVPVGAACGGKGGGAPFVVISLLKGRRVGPRRQRGAVCGTKTQESRERDGGLRLLGVLYGGARAYRATLAALGRESKISWATPGATFHCNCGRNEQPQLSSGLLLHWEKRNGIGRNAANLMSVSTFTNSLACATEGRIRDHLAETYHHREACAWKDACAGARVAPFSTDTVAHLYAETPVSSTTIAA